MSAAPILNDIGEGAVNAMGEALTQGLSQMVGDLSGGALSIGQDEPGDSISAVLGNDDDKKQFISTQPSEKRPRRIPMPAGFPGTGTTSTNTPLPTPGPSQHRQAHSTQPNHTYQSHRPAPLSRSGSYLQTQTGRTTSTAPSSANQQDQHFRFRGQFASQPGTPGVGGGRQLGALNSRAE